MNESEMSRNSGKIVGINGNMITVEFKGADLRALMMREMPFGMIMLERVCFLLRDRIQHAYGALERI